MTNVAKMSSLIFPKLTVRSTPSALGNSSHDTLHTAENFDKTPADFRQFILSVTAVVCLLFFMARENIV